MHRSESSFDLPPESYGGSHLLGGLAYCQDKRPTGYRKTISTGGRATGVNLCQYADLTECDARPVSRGGLRLRRRRRAGQLQARKEESDLGARRVRAIRAVHGILLDVGPELAADGPLRRLLRI